MMIASISRSVKLRALRLLFTLTFTTLMFATDPGSGSLSPTSTTPAQWNGTMSGAPPTGEGTLTCTDGVNCESFVLNVPAGTWTGKRIAVTIKWSVAADDYDLYVHKDTPDGKIVAQSAGAPPTTSENTFIDPELTGTGNYYITVINAAAAESTDQYSGIASVVAKASGPVPAPQGTAPLPRYQTYRPPVGSGLGLHAGEPSVGINPRTGRAMFQSDLQTLRVTFFDNNIFPAPRSVWEDKSPQTSVEDSDPILFTDQATGRTFVSMLLLLSGQSEDSYTDNDGDLWVPQKNAPTSAVDHQTEGAGPYKSPAVSNLVYPNAVYYCSQDLVTALCSRSDDGGLTFGPTVPIYTTECGGLHGHVKVSPSGTVYVPNKNCGGQQGFAVSDDNGNTWAIRTVPGTSTGSSDPSIGIGTNNRVYFGFANNDHQAAIAYTDDEGATWSPSYDVGAALGIQNIAFPEVTSGDNDRAAFAFLGTKTAGTSSDPGFRGVWHMYASHTYDGGKSWQTVDTTPNDAVQRGPIWFSGGAVNYRNLLDFNDAQHDAKGNVVYAVADGCAGANCNQAASSATGNGYTALATIIRQTGGLPLFRVNDTTQTAKLPGAPVVTVRRSGTAASLSWSESDNGGSGVTKYRIYRGTASGQETPLVAVSGSTTHYVDTKATDTSVTYFYRVTAVNAVGESKGTNEVASAYIGDTCNGMSVARDPAGDQTGAPLNPDLDVRSLAVSEPTADTLKFVLKVNGLPVLANGSTTPARKWVVSWNYPTATSDGGQYYVAMISNASGVVTFEYGTITTQVVGLLVGVPTANMVGYADPTSNFTADGTITILVPKAQVGNAAAGDIMGSVLAKSYADPTNNLRSTLVVDSTANAANSDPEANAAMYTFVGNGCSATTTTTNSSGKKVTNKTSSVQTDFASMLSGVQVVSF
jgi:hypothetical protein